MGADCEYIIANKSSSSQSTDPASRTDWRVESSESGRESISRTVLLITG